VLKPSDLLFVAYKPEVQYGRETGSEFPSFLTKDELNCQMKFPTVFSMDGFVGQ
jgi:hypothetical protein